VITTQNKTANAAALLEARNYKGKNLITPAKAYRVKNVEYNINLSVL